MMVISANLIHHTGSMIRFTTRQLKYLPKRDEVVDVILPDGSKVKGKFRRHPANPYIAGRKIVYWIKSFVPFRKKEIASVRIISKKKYLVYIGKSWVKSKRGNILLRREKESLRELFNKLLKISKKPTKIRRREYHKVLSKRINSALVKKVFGVECQVENCEYTANEDTDVVRFLTEVHHLEHLARRGTNSPFNLAVVCSNHHSIFHRDKTAKIIECKGDNVRISYNNGNRKKWIIRNLSILHSMQDK